MAADSPDRYRRAVAEVLQQAARMGLVERVYRIGRRGTRLDIATSLGSALLVLDKLTASDGEVRAWMAVSELQPELGTCVSHLRWMTRTEERIERGMQRLEELQGRTRQAAHEFHGLERQAVEAEGCREAPRPPEGLPISQT